MSAADAPNPAALPRLAALGAHLLQPWRELPRVPPFSWMEPAPAVCLLHADGSQSLWSGEQRRSPSPREGEAARFVAVEIPGSEALECTVPLPPLSEVERQQALALAVRAASPFDPAELVWGWRSTPEGATALLASRRAVESRLAAAADRLRGRGPAEAWVFGPAGRPVVLQGFGEAARQQRASFGRRLGGLLLLCALLLLAGALLTPTLQLRLRALQAQQAHGEAERRLAPLLAQREALVKAQVQQAALREQMNDRVEPLAVLDLMSQAIPEDSFAQRLQLQGDKLTLTGQTPNTAALMNRLSAQPLLRDVRSPAAATRGMTAGRENFTIEMTLQPEALRPARAAAVATEAVTTAPAPASAPATAASGVPPR